MENISEVGEVGPHDMVYAERRPSDSDRVVCFCAWCDYETTKKYMLQHYRCERDRYKDNDRYTID